MYVYQVTIYHRKQFFNYLHRDIPMYVTMKRLLWLPFPAILIFLMKFSNSYNVFQIFIATFPVKVHHQKFDLKVNGYLMKGNNKCNVI